MLRIFGLLVVIVVGIAIFKPQSPQAPAEQVRSNVAAPVSGNTVPVPRARPANAKGIVQASATGNMAHDILAKMSDQKRNTTLTSFMRASGERCEVVRNFFQGLSKDRDAFWNVRCSSEESYSIQITNDAEGSTKILNCAILRMVAKVECFKTFASQ